ncbi:MAG: TatD family hydrolase, partial [Nanoarchaeota archaeon]
MNLVDVHAHLTDEKFKADLDMVLHRAKEAGVKAVICNGTNPINNREILALAKQHDLIKVALGAYPTDALGLEETETGLVPSKQPWDFDKEVDFIESQKNHIVAIGEVGLEYKHVTDPLLRKLQVQNLSKILALA